MCRPPHKDLSIAGGLTHYWVPTVRTSVIGSYARIEYPGIESAVTPGGFVTGFPGVDEWRIGGNMTWAPVEGLNLGLEVLYVNAAPKGRVLTPAGFLESPDSEIEGRIRVQRDV